jgi:hypothetical protein
LLQKIQDDTWTKLCIKQKILSSADKLKDIPDLERVCIPQTSVCLVIPHKEPKA